MAEERKRIRAEAKELQRAGTGLLLLRVVIVLIALFCPCLRTHRHFGLGA